MGNPLLLRADARALPLADASVDLVVTSPPYFALRSYTDTCRACLDIRAHGLDPAETLVDYDEHVRVSHHYDSQIGAESTPAAYVQSLLDVTRECMRVLRPGGSIWVNLGDTYSSKANAGASVGRSRRADRAEVIPIRRNTTQSAPYKSLLLIPERYRIGCVDQLGLTARAVTIWSKPSGLPEGRVRDRVHRTHEDWVHLTLGPTYYSDCDAVRQPHAAWTARAYEYERAGYARRSNGDRVDRGGFAKAPTVNPAGKMPGSVWEIATEPLKVPAELGVDHFAAFPTEWPRRIILGWSPPGGTVLDPFGGTGTTALVADALGRQAISVDMSADYSRLAAWRTSDPGQRAKARGLPKPVPQSPGQGDLFELAGGDTRA